MPAAPPPKGTLDIDPSATVFSPVGDETRTVGADAVDGFIREGNDIPLVTKKTLADYLSRKTATNDFPVSADVYTETSITSPTGLPAKMDFRDPAAQPTYTNPGYTNDPNTGQPIPQVRLRDYVQTGGGVGDSDALKWTQENLSKGRTDSPRAYNGNTLLRDVGGQKPRVDGQFTDNGQDHEAIVDGYTSKVLLHNRFTPAAAASKQRGFVPGQLFVLDNSGGRDGANRFIHRHQSQFGVYDPNAPEIDPAVLDKIGPMLALRATGELGANDSGFDPPDNMNFRTILPGITQLGLSRVDTLNLEARKVLQDIAGGVPADGHLESDFETSALSYGQINSYADPFSGLLPLGMSALAIALILAAQIAVDLFTAVMNLISTASSSVSTSRDTLGRHLLGKSYTNPGQERGGLSLPLPARLFGIERTQHVYSDAVAKGLETFFAVDLGRTVIEPGFFVVFLRSILASAAVLVRKVKDIFGSGNPFNILNAIVGFLDAIRSSKLIAAMNVFAHIGDQALVLDESNPSDPSRPSTIDDINESAIGTSAVKNRQNGSLKLAWRSSTAPMTMLLPVSLRAAGVAKNLTTKLAGMNRNYGGASTTYEAIGPKDNKIPLDVMRDVETRMEAEYVPFYFHDTRTNEIIGFHAFLTTLTDSYTTAFDSTDAYGRVDPVKIYKNTARSISLSFMVVATDEDDFDHMWMKINKLITLVYPQWSEGQLKKSADGNKFIQPFSQVPAASPLFRLRVGDVIKSNYSRFALKRIFGYGSNNFQHKDPSTGKMTNARGLEGLAASEKAKNSSAAAFGELDGRPRLNHKFLLRPAPVSGYTLVGSKTTTENLRNRSHIRVTVIKISDEAVFVRDDVGNKYSVVPADLIPLKDESAPESKTTANSDSIDASFFSAGDSVGSGPDSRANSIVRSFETAMSKGLACIINSMNFNWMEHAQWETEIFGSRAPKIAKIDMTLTPFHDITPGLDSYGANRAPVYNVGQYANLMSDDDPNGEEKFATNREALWGRRK